MLNVGNAASTVLGEDDDTPRVLLDGGRKKNLPDLVWYLTNRSHVQKNEPSVHNLQTLVVSHFDVDHWGGLASLGRAHAHSGQNAPLSIFFPRMPEVASQVPAAMFFLRYAAGELPMPFTAESLAADWRTGRTVRLAGLRRGDVVSLASASFRVLWPPRTLPSARAESLKAALEKVRDVARDDPYFGPLYDELHENPFGVGDDEVGGLREGWQEDMQDDDTEPVAKDEGVEDDEAAGGFADLPDELVESAKIIHRWNNDLSLVLAATDDSFLAMGDVTSRWAVAGALQSAAPHYTRMLAPHHGTHADQNLPSADECFMQTGHGHATRSHLHIAAHGQAVHVCTHTAPKQGHTVRQVAACTDATCQHPSTGGFFRR